MTIIVFRFVESRAAIPLTSLMSNIVLFQPHACLGKNHLKSHEKKQQNPKRSREDDVEITTSQTQPKRLYLEDGPSTSPADTVPNLIITSAKEKEDSRNELPTNKGHIQGHDRHKEPSQLGDANFSSKGLSNQDFEIVDSELRQCDFCTFSCVSKVDLLRHQFSSHQGDSKFRVSCSICLEQFKTYTELKNHLKSHEKKPQNLKQSHNVDSALSSKILPKKFYLLDQPSASSDHTDAKFENSSAEVTKDSQCNLPTSVGQTTDHDNLIEASDMEEINFYFRDLPNQDKSLELQLQEKAAAFLSHIKDSCITTQKTVDEIVKNSDELIVLYNSVLEAQVVSKREADGFIDSKVVQEVFEYYRKQSMFEGLRTKYRQDEYRKMQLSDIQPLLVVTKYHSTVTPRKGIIHEVPAEFGYAAPFLVQLEALLNQVDILSCIRNPVNRTPGQYRTPLDGSVYQNHLPSYDGSSENLLCFGGYCDDVNAGDTLSVQGANIQIRSFSWILLNIHPWLRSSLKCINILALVLKKHAKKNGPFLEDFIHGLQRLASKEGVTFNIRGKLLTFHGVLVFWVGDTPASANIAGFKESPGQALSPCRQCLVRQDSLHQHSCEVPELMRNAELHNQHLALVCPTPEDEAQEEEEQASHLKGSNPSSLTGVNSRSPLLDLEYFDVTVSFPQDVMHVLAEGGVLDVTTRLILLHAIDKKLTLKTINTVIQGFDYGDLIKDRPGPIKPKHLTSSLRQNASQLFLLVHVIPFIVEGNCDEPHLRNYVRLLTIVNLCMARVLTDGDIDILRKLIEEFLSEFKVTYGENNLTPKCHFMVHIPSQISLFGPPTQHCAMRFEAYHAILKRLYKILHTSKNLCYSLMERLLLRSLQEMHSSPPGKFLYSGHVGAGLKPAIELKSIPQLSPLINSKPGFSEETTVVPVNSVNFHGINYRVGCSICLNSSSALPSIMLVSKIYLHNDPILLCRPYQTIAFDVKLNAYEIQGQSDSSLVAVFPDVQQPMFPILKIKFHNRLLAILRENTPFSITALQEWKDEDSMSDIDWES
ncbi:Zinc finger protein CRM3 [Frankliniella fusca]|uniref:Zinc finger protein CRM3 n=1 Tax=Frankliniella fusca TaxID=407009 RepID=A0AAE1H8X9_9NEOP|nr:Zinc finger protein CRM3 [Frankliniella fusca]